MNEFFQKDIISVRDLNKQKLEVIFEATNKIINMDPNKRREIARGKALGYLFYESSTRTRLSFEAAMALIGGTSLGISDVSSSSTQKGESLADTVKIMSIYSDVLVLRHSLDGSSRFAAEVSSKPVINWGSGTEEHPTQAIQDLFTIKKEKNKIDGLKIGIVGDLKYGRTVYSLLYA
jgi:aspartate carbamoyltransferase catalytic subunit